MPPTYRPSLVSLRNIDFQDTDNSLCPEETPAPSPALLRSVGRVGILHPPFLREKGGARLQIVTGRRRLLAAQESRREISAVCLLLPEETTDAEALAINLEDTVLRGRVSLAEQAVFFQKILNFVDIEKAARRFLPLVGQEPRPQTVTALVELLRLEEHLLLAVHQGFLHPAVGRSLLGLSFTDRLSLFEAMETACLGHDDQQRLAAACRSQAERQGTSVMALLAAPEVRKILDQHSGDQADKAAKLMEWFTGARANS